MIDSDDRPEVAPPPDRSEKKAAALAEWEAADKANPPTPEPVRLTEEQRMAAEDPDAASVEPIVDRPANEEAVDAELERAAVAEEQTPADPIAQRGLAAIEARERRQREQAQEREAKLRGYEQTIRQKEAELIAREKRMAERELRALQDPVGFYREMGLKDGYRDIAEQFYIAEVGDAAPPELKMKAQTFSLAQEQRRQAAELQQMRAQLDQERQQLAVEAQVQAYRQQLSADLGKLPPKFQYVKAIAQRDPQRAVELMFAEAAEYARANPHDADPPPVDLLADALEKKFSPYYGTTPKNQPPVQAGEKRTATPVNQPHAGRTPLRPTPKTREELREEVLRDLEGMG